MVKQWPKAVPLTAIWIMAKLLSSAPVLKGGGFHAELCFNVSCRYFNINERACQ